jgi:hypothetical protein
MLGINQQVAVVNTEDSDGEATSTQPQTATSTSTATPTSTPTSTATTGQNPTATMTPTNTPSSTPEPIDPNDFCPSSPLNFEGDFYENGNKSWEIKIKNISAVGFDLENITNFVWTNKNANLTKIEWDGTKIWPSGSQTSQSPFSFSWPDDSQPTINGKTGSDESKVVELKFTFDKNSNTVTISSLMLDFAKSDDETCSKPLPY